MVDLDKLPADCEVWTSGDVTLIRGDGLAVLPAISGVDCVVTSPPYDNLRTYGGYRFSFQETADEILNALADGGVIAWIVNDQSLNGSESCTSFRQAIYFRSIGLNLHDTMIYAKANPLPLNHRRYEQAFEFMFVLSKGSPKTANIIRDQCKHPGRKSGGTHRRDAGGGADRLVRMHGADTPIGETKQRSNIWTYPVGGKSLGHPAPFPLELASDHVLSWTNESDIVCDPFTGSGTTGVACVNLNRKFIGIEIDPAYFEIAKQRIVKAQSAKSEQLIA